MSEETKNPTPETAEPTASATEEPTAPEAGDGAPDGAPEAAEAPQADAQPDTCVRESAYFSLERQRCAAGLHCVNLRRLTGTEYRGQPR
ncbi:MAG: hypothetical protein R3181_14650, partial [Rubricoccaceae bacterium]|nr:hypothetical protein [Rubricoccaceae bacterium]